MNLDPYGIAAQYRMKVFSQNAEDGITIALTDLLDPPKQFVEIGTGDGSENNTRILLDRGWRGLWIDPVLADVGAPPGVVTVARKFTIPEALESDTSKTGLLSIDIDGNDWHMWKALGRGPAIVIIECNIERPLDVEWVMDYDPDHVSTPGHTNYGASLASMIALGRELGYTFVAMEFINAFFVRDDLMPKLVREAEHLVAENDK